MPYPATARRVTAAGSGGPAHLRPIIAEIQMPDLPAREARDDRAGPVEQGLQLERLETNPIIGIGPEGAHLEIGDEAQPYRAQPAIPRMPRASPAA